MTTIRKPNEEDVVNYWKLVLQNPSNQNPMTDHNGSLSLHGQNPSNNLVYLSGNTGGNDSRNIPGQLTSDRAIFVAVNPVVITEPEAPNADLKQTAKNDEDSATKANLIINGKVHDLKAEGFRVGTDVFEVTLPANALFNYPSGQCKAVADGYYAIIEGVPPGNDNKIEIDAAVANPHNQPAPWESKVTYNFKVQ